jgi:hypothetical protein
VKYPEGLSPDEREAYDQAYAQSFVGAADRLGREWVNVKQAIYDVLPPIVQRFIRLLRGA